MDLLVTVTGHRFSTFTWSATVSYAIDIKQAPAVQVATWTTTTTMVTVAETVDRGFATVMAAIGKMGTHPAGVPFIVYHEMFDETTPGTIQICIPVPAGTTGEVDGVAFTTVGASSVASTTHRGPYTTISQAYDAVAAWVQEQGHGFAGPPREVYITDPRTVREEDLRTEVQFPVIVAA